MQQTDPYKLLKVSSEASDEEVEAAYDRLFDRYEVRAQRGDPAAIAMLEQLNEAHDTLLDPDRRAALASTGPRSSTSSRTSSRLEANRPGAGRRAGTTESIKVRPRAGSLSTRSYARPERSPLPYIAIAVLAVGLVASLLYLLNTPAAAPQPEPDRGNVVATVNGVPIYERDFNERVERDKQTALADPLFAPFFDNFQGITGTRALDVLRYDALDKLINMEVIQQQAKKENFYPGPAQQAELVAEAKAGELATNETFEAFLQRVGISEAQYNRRVVENFVYTVMAEQHMPKTGTNTERTEGFIRWICDTRQNYDAVVKLSFTVTENRPCTSGLPSDLPLPGITEGTPVPEPIATSEVPAIRPAEASPTATAAAPADQ